MRIGIDTRIAGQLTGIGRYTDNLLRYLLPLLSEDHCYLFSSKTLPADHLADCDHEKIIWETDHGRRWEQFFVPYQIWRHKLDLYHCLLNHGLPWWAPCKFVVTIHDLVQLHFPHQYQILPGQAMGDYRRRVTWAAKKATLIITPSESSKLDIIDLLGCSSEKVRVIPYGRDERFRPLDKQECVRRVRRKFPDIQNEFILYVGDLSYRKNIDRVLEAFGRMEHSLRTSVDLVLVHNENVIVDLAPQTKELGLDGKLICLENVSDGLVDLYNAAQVFVFPSLYEGFGLPPLEAMACGTPVITSSVSSLPEVAGDAAVLVDPYNVEEIAQALCGVLNSEQFKISLRERGLERAQKFSWDKVARQTLEVYREVYDT